MKKMMIWDDVWWLMYIAKMCTYSVYSYICICRSTCTVHNFLYISLYHIIIYRYSRPTSSKTRSGIPFRESHFEMIFAWVLNQKLRRVHLPSRNPSWAQESKGIIGISWYISLYIPGIYICLAYIYIYYECYQWMLYRYIYREIYPWYHQVPSGYD